MDPMPLSSGAQKLFKNVFLKFRVHEIAKKWRKLAKKSKQRYYKLREWSTTEQSYLQRLVRLRDEVRGPLKASHMINELEQVLIFANLDSMIQLGLEMKEKIDKLLATWDPIRTELAPTVESLAIYLKIYKEYSNNFTRADTLIQELKKSPKFKEVVKLDYVEDYLIKPVQRPLQYKLFVNEYLNALPKYHKDYPELTKGLKTLLKIADQINEFVESQMRATKMIQLDKVFGDIIESSRTFKSQFQAETLEHKCRIYVFNNLLLGARIVSEQREDPLFRIPLCGGSYVIKQQDNKTFRNRLYICGSQKSIHLTFPSPADVERTYQLIEGILSNIYQKEYNREELISKVKFRRETMVMNRHSAREEYKWKEQPRYRIRLKIEVIGVDKRLYDNQWRIVYAVKIQLGKPENIYQIAFYEVDELREIQKYIGLVYSSSKIPALDSRYKGMSSDDIKIDFTKYAEYRSIIIEDFINSALRSPLINERPELIAYKLRIHQALWDYLNKVSVDMSATECGCQACLRNQIFTGIDFYEKQRASIRRRNVQFCITKAFHTQNTVGELVDAKSFKKFTIEQKLLWAVCKQKRIDYGVLLPEFYGKSLTFAINVNLVSEDSIIIIKEATVNSTCREVIDIFCQRRGIETGRDLTLVFVNGQYQHELDDDEYIIDYVKYLDDSLSKKQMEVNRGTRMSIFQGFSKSFDDLGETAFENHKASNKPKLFVRKIYTFPYAEQEKACQQNFERYPLVLGELLKRFKQQNLLLSASEIKVFCALFYNVQEFNTIIFSKKIFIQEDKVKKYLPQSKWGFVNREFLEEIKAIIENQVKLCDNITPLYRIILKQFGDKVGWLTKFFPIQNTDPSSLSGNSTHLLIGVNHKKVIVTRKYNLANLLEFSVCNFTYRISGTTIFVQTEDKTYQFVGSNLLLLHNMVQKYKLIHEFESQLF